MEHKNPPPPPPYSPPGQDPQFHPGTHQPGPATIVTQPTVMVQPALIVTQGVYVDANPTLTVCRSCQNQIVTRVELTPSCRTHVIAGILCLFIFWPCACLPYCIGSCNNADHYCPNCNAFIGSYRF